jgi:hypothetical protein
VKYYEPLSEVGLGQLNRSEVTGIFNQFRGHTEEHIVKTIALHFLYTIKRLGIFLPLHA